MIGSIDKFLDRQYDQRRYNCLHFARDVWLDQTGVDITEALQTVFDPTNRSELRRTLARFQRIDKPIDPCLVMMHRPRFAPHIGVFIRGRVLHIHEPGVEFQPVQISSLGFTSVRYYLCR